MEDLSNNLDQFYFVSDVHRVDPTWARLISHTTCRSLFPATLLDVPEIHALHPRSMFIIDTHSVSEALLYKLKLDLGPMAHSLPVVFINLEDVGNSSLPYEWARCLGLFGKHDEPYLLRKGLVKILVGERWFSRGMMSQLLAKSNQHTSRKELEMARLTKKEAVILTKLMEGCTNMQLAESLYISQHTVKAHLYHIFKKIDVSSRAEAIAWGHRNIE